MPSQFSTRVCPACAGTAADCVLDLQAASFCSPNPTYSREYQVLLGVDEHTSFPVVRCNTCGFVYAQLEPDAGFLNTLYEKVIGSSHNAQANEQRSGYALRMRYVADLVSLAPLDGPNKALDFGCGLGITLRMLNAAGVKAVGYDNSEVRRQYATDNAMRIAHAIEEVRELAPFDIVVCDNVLEHLPDPRGTLRLLASLCAPAAVMYVSVPNGDGSFLGRQGERLRNGGTVDMALNPWEHLNYFDLHHLDRMLDEAGFSAIPATELAFVDIGLRSESNLITRLKNSLASTLRMARYAATGTALRNPTYGFYRLRA